MMARGEDTGHHPGRRVDRERFENPSIRGFAEQMGLDPADVAIIAHQLAGIDGDEATYAGPAGGARIRVGPDEFSNQYLHPEAVETLKDHFGYAEGPMAGEARYHEYDVPGEAW